MVLLVGSRYGGLYANTPKSITWREYEEALQLGIPVIPLVLRHVNEDAERWSKHQLATPPFGRETDSLIAFIDRIRKGHADNWMHALWDGSFHEARETIQHRMNALFVTYQQGPRREVRERAERFKRYAFASLELDELASELGVAPIAKDTALDVVLGSAALHRAALFGFESSDRWNLAIYRWDADVHSLGVLARHVDPRIPIGDRRWRSGEGHVGATWERGEVLVAADLTVTSAWANALPTDVVNYRSAIAVPMRASPDSSWGILVITSDRLDHFRDLDQIEVLTASALALRLEKFIRVEGTP